MRASLPVRSFDAAEAAERWRCSIATATEIIFGADGGFVAQGLVESEGDGRVVVTRRGLELAHAMRWLPEVSS